LLARVFRRVTVNIVTHEFTEHLSSRLVLVATGTEELLAQLPVYPNSKPDVFCDHRRSVANGCTFVYPYLPNLTLGRGDDGM